MTKSFIRNLTIIIVIVCIWKGLYAQDTWEFESSPVNNSLRKIVFPDSLNGWAVGDSGTIIHTSDGGNHWEIQNSRINSNIISVTFPDKHNGWALSLESGSINGTVILNTIDGGNSWDNYLYPENGVFLTSIIFIDSITGWMGGYGGGIVYTTNAGKEWIKAEIDSLSGFPLNSFTFSDKNYGFACGGIYDFAGVIFMTTNGGINWTGKYVSPEPLQKLFILDSLNIIGTGGDFEFGITSITSSDRGMSWTNRNLDIFGIGIGLSFRTKTEGWISVSGGFKGKLIYSEDKGDSWKEYNTPNGYFISDIVFPDTLHGHAVGLNGVILKYIHPISGIKQPANVSQGYSLNQNFPNPFNSLTTITYSISKQGYVTLIVYDLLGNKITSLVNEYQNQGKYNINFNTSKLTSGVYFYQLRVNDFVSNKKMVLTK